MTDSTADPPAGEALAAHYDRLWDDAAPNVAAGLVTIDPWLARRDADPRRNLTLLARPSGDLRERLGEFLGGLRALEPEQRFQPPPDLHVTVLTLFSAVDGSPFLEQLAAYRDAVAEALAGAPAFTVAVRGVTLSHQAVLAQGFPRDGTLERVRARLRTALAARGVDGGLDRRYRLRTAHLTLARFAAPLRRPAAFVQALAEARRRPFGTLHASSLELVVGDWYQSADRTRLIDRIPLPAPRGS